MGRTRWGSAVVLAVFAGTLPPFFESSYAQGSCNREIARQDAALRRFANDAEREGMDFARDELKEAALDVMKEKLQDNPTYEAYEEFKEAWDEWREFMEQSKSIHQFLQELSACMNARGTGCLKELADHNRQSSELLNRAAEKSREWVESLAEDNFQKARERVEKARNIMQNLTTRAGDLATSATNGAMQNCFRDLERRVEARRDPVDLRSSQPASQPSTPQPPAPRQPENTGGNGGSAASGGSGGGMGAGAVGGIVAAGAGAGAGLYALNEYQKSIKCTQYETQIQSDMNSFNTAANNAAACRTESCFNQRIPAVNNAISRMLATAGEWCTCLGPNATSEIPAADRAAVRAALSELRSLGVTSGTLPSCFR